MAKMIIKPYEKKDGNTYYMFTYRIGTDAETGKELKTSRRGFKTEKAAEKAYKKLVAQVVINGYKTRKTETVKDLYDIWLPSYEKRVRESTFDKTVGIFETHILPTLGKYRLEKLTVQHCQESVDKWAETRKRPDKVGIYAKKLFKYGISLDLLVKNPMDFVIYPIKDNFSVENEEYGNFYTKYELLTFLSSLSKEKPLKKAFFHLLASSGFRRGEILPLMWKDVDFINGTITINKNLAYGKKGQLILTPPKTKASKRAIKIDDDTLEELKKWRKTQTKELSAKGLRKKENQLIFQNSKNEWLQPTIVRKWILSIVQKNNLPDITVHGFRHTHCSILFEAGADMKEVQSRLGHSSIKITLEVYTHITENKKNDTALKYAEYMKS